MSEIQILCDESLLGNKWVTRAKNLELIESIKSHFNLSFLSASVLVSRGFSFEEIADFLNPTLKQSWEDPSSLPDLTQALELIIEAIKSGGPIGILGDYDVDGVSSSVIWKEICDYFKIPSYIWLPKRLAGYGPSHEALQFFTEHKPALLILVDCGTSAHEFMQEYQGKTVIIDHHITDKVSGSVVVNPHRPDVHTNEVFKSMCASALSFLVAHQLLFKLGVPNAEREKLLISLLDLVSLATVCDVMELTSLNRALLAKGLKLLEEQKRHGLKAIIRNSQIRFPLTTGDIGFYIGPKLNAAGRLNDPMLAFELLSTKDEDKAVSLANELEKLNQERRIIQEMAYQDALQMVENYPVDERIIFLASDNWHAGIIGIIAAQVQEKMKRPVIVGSIQGDIIKASARSNLIHIGNLIQKAVLSKIIESGGGHAKAAGFSCTKDQWDCFKVWYAEHVDVAVKEPLIADLVLDLENIDQDFHKLAPYGPSNEEVIIMSKDLRVVKIYRSEKSVRVTLQQHLKDHTFFVQLRQTAIIAELEKAYANRKAINILLKLSQKGFHNICDLQWA